jgi:prevent-host-death family protein
VKEVPISVTEAARNFADCVNRVRYQGASFLLEKNGVPVARIVPVEPASIETAVSREPESARTVPGGERVDSLLNQDEIMPADAASGKTSLPTSRNRVLLNW